MVAASEVEIRVTGSNSSTAATDAAKRGIKGVGDEAATTSVKVKGLGESVKSTTRATDDLGDKARRTTRDLSALDRKILELRASTLALGKQFETTGDSSLLKKFRSDSHELAGLERMRKQMAGLAGDVASVGREAASSASTFSALFQGGLINALKSPTGLAVAGAVGVPAAIGVGATVGGVVTGAAGLGVAGAGVAGAAMQSQRVRDEWARTTSEIKSEFLDATTSFEGPTVAAIGKIRGAFHDVDMKSIFGHAAQFVEPLADSAAKAVGSFGRGVDYLVARAGPAVTAIANGVESLGDATEIAMKQIGDGSQGGAEALDNVIGAISDVIVLSGFWIGKFEQAYEATDRLGRGLGELHPLLGLLNDEINGEKVSQLSGELDHAAAAARGAYDNFEDLSAGMYNTADAADQLNDSFTDLFNITMSQAEADLRVMQGFADLKEELEDGKKTLDKTTQAGRDNVGAIYEQLEALNRKREADIAAGNGTVESARAANEAYASQVEGIRQMLIKLGFAKSEVESFISTWLSMNGKTVDITVNTFHNDYYARMGAGGSAFDPGARDERRGLATGGIVGAASGMVVSGGVNVGEHGRELALLAPGRAMLPPGSQVIPNGTTENMLAGGRGGGGDQLLLSVDGAADSEVAALVMRLIRDGLITVRRSSLVDR